MNLESFSYSVSDNNVLEVSAYQASKSLMSQLNPADPNYIVTKGVWLFFFFFFILVKKVSTTAPHVSGQKSDTEKISKQKKLKQRELPWKWQLQ